MIFTKQRNTTINFNSMAGAKMKLIYLAAAMTIGMTGTALANPVNSYNKDDHSIHNTNTNANLNANVNRNSAKQSQGQAQEQRQGQTQSQGIKGSGNSKVSVDGNNASQSTTVIDEAQRRNPVSTAYAPPPVASEDTCMGSSTGGGQLVSFGLSFGTTWKDKNCKRLKNSRELNGMGMHRSACALLSHDSEVAKAIRESGSSCSLLSDVPVVVIQPASEPVKEPEASKGERG